jgi:hypothetical protein
MSERTRTAINWMTRSELCYILEGFCFQVYDDESVDMLRQALIVNVEDGSIPEYAIN